MFINPRQAIELGWIKGNIPEKSIQPNAIDFDLDRVFQQNPSTLFVLSEQSKHMRALEEVNPIPNPNDNLDWWFLSANSYYDFQSSLYVEIPQGIVAWLIARSTLNRNGIFLTSGLYDSGFKGPIAGIIHNRSGVARIAKGTRIGQILFARSDSAGLYAGGYNVEQGKHYTEN